MSNVIGFLEKMGQDAQLRHASNSEMELALSNAQINPELQTAVLSSNQSQLETLLGARTNVCGMVFPVKENEEEEEKDPPKDDDEITNSHLVVRRVATSS